MLSKKYKKGMADAAKAYEAFGNKQEEALKHILNEVREGKRDLEDIIKGLDGNINNLYDYLLSKEKANLYTVYTPFDIQNLDEHEKLFLLGAILSLTVDNAPNEHQQKYIRSIQKYLDIKELPFDVNPLAIENIENTTSQKAIYQVILEYLILQDGDSYDETELQQDFLESFNLNAKTRATIANHVEILYSATGAEGLAEKYGYEEETEDTDTSTQYENETAEKQTDCTDQAIELAISYVKQDSWNQVAAETDDYIVIFSSFYSQEEAKVLIISKRSGVLVNSFSGSRFCDSGIEVSQAVCSHKNILCIATPKKICLYDIDNDVVTTVIEKYMIDNLEASFYLLCFNGKYAVIGTYSRPRTFLVDCDSSNITEIPNMRHRAIIKDNCIIYDSGDTLHRYNFEEKVDEVIFDCNRYLGTNKYIYRVAKSTWTGWVDIGDFGIYNNKIYFLIRVGAYDQSISDPSVALAKYSIYSLNYNVLSDIKCVYENIPLYSCGTDAFFCDNSRNYINGFIWVGEDNEYMFNNSPCFNIYKFEYGDNKMSKISSHSGCCHRYGLRNRIQAYSPSLQFMFFRKSLIYKQFYRDMDGPIVFPPEFNTFVNIENSTTKSL